MYLVRNCVVYYTLEKSIISIDRNTFLSIELKGVFHLIISLLYTFIEALIYIWVFSIIH